MGSYYKVANPVKREYLDPGYFGEAIKASSVLRDAVCIQALKCLIMDDRILDVDYFSRARNPWDLQGSWVGDPVILTGDDTSPPNPAGILTAKADNPKRNLNHMAQEEFSNISELALAMLCESDFAYGVLESSETNEKLFLALCDLAIRVKPPGLVFVLTRHYAGDWMTRYRELTREHRGHRK